jgi:hypothetical protein
LLSLRRVQPMHDAETVATARQEQALGGWL